MAKTFLTYQQQLHIKTEANKSTLIELDKEYPEYGFAKNKGYGTKEHTDAIKKYGLCKAHRRSFCKKFV